MLQWRSFFVSLVNSCIDHYWMETHNKHTQNKPDKSKNKQNTNCKILRISDAPDDFMHRNSGAQRGHLSVLLGTQGFSTRLFEPASQRLFEASRVLLQTRSECVFKKRLGPLLVTKSASGDSLHHHLNRHHP